MRIFAFDIGLRNLAAVVISKKPDFTFAGLPQFKTFLTEDETADEFKMRALQYCLAHAWNLEQWDLIDVSEILDREVKNVKRLSDVSKAIALADSLQALEDRWFRDSAPDIVCVETQHNANAIMRGVSMGTLVFFRRSFPETALESKSGGHKLKICEALGIHEGAGLVPGATKKAAAAEKKELKERAKEARRQMLAVKKKTSNPPSLVTPPVVPDVFFQPLPETALEEAPAAKVEVKGRRSFGFKRGSGEEKKKKEKYEDNKLRAVLAVNVLMPEGHDILRLHFKKQDDLCDVLLMSLWVLWCNILPRCPVRRKLKPAV